VRQRGILQRKKNKRAGETSRPALYFISSTPPQRPKPPRCRFPHIYKSDVAVAVDKAVIDGKNFCFLVYHYLKAG
jgi:hypothetical protein